MSYSKRFDGRKWDETRPISAKTGIVKRADGSAMFQIGKTVAYAAVYGPRDLYPRFLQNPEKGVLRCKYNMMPFSGAGERVRPGTSRRSTEISKVITEALKAVVNLDEFPNAGVDVFIELPQTDAGTRCAGLCAASMALADAGISMKDMVTSVSMGKVDDKLVVDLDYEEESYEGGEVADIPVGMLPRNGEIVLLQMDGKISEEELYKALEMVRPAMDRIRDVQMAALKARFGDNQNGK